MNLYRVDFSTSYPFYVIEQDEVVALRRAIQALKDYGALRAEKVTIEKICSSGHHLVLSALDEKIKQENPDKVLDSGDR